MNIVYLMDKIFLISVFVSLVSTLIFLPKWIKKARHVGLLWEDMNKWDQPKNVAASGGIVVVMAFLVGVLSYIALRTFFMLQENGTNIQIFALLSVILILAIIGLTDDLLGWSHGGLSPLFRFFLVLVASIPLIVINAGTSSMSLPFIGYVEFGILYPLVLIPLGVAGAGTVYNFLAGMNGLEASQGILILSFLSYVAFKTGSSWLSVISLCMVASLIVFYFFNKCPAKVFPGDIMTYSIGALIACMAILGNFEKITVFIFIPYIIEMCLKVRGGLKKQSFGKPKEDKSLDLPYDKIYGLTHLSIYILKGFKKKVYERDVVYFILGIELVFILIGVLMI